MDDINKETFELSQNEVDSLLMRFISKQVEQKTLIDEIKEALLDSAKLSLVEWHELRDRIREIEEVVPHIDAIIKFKSEAKQ